jgi:hypothetical protein
MPRTGQELKIEWKIPAEQVLYSEDGNWYHLLHHFPAALCDANGYVLFKTEQDYNDCPQLVIREAIVVRDGISKLPGYILMRHTTDKPEEIEDALETSFGLERDLQHALRANIEQLEAGLKIVDGGKEQHVEAGWIDITAQDKQGATVVIELKAGEADRNAVAQVLSYMGNLIEGTKKPVRGIVVASDFKVNAVSAARAASNIELKKYNFKFSFRAANE